MSRGLATGLAIALPNGGTRNRRGIPEKSSGENNFLFAQDFSADEAHNTDVDWRPSGAGQSNDGLFTWAAPIFLQSVCRCALLLRTICRWRTWSIGTRCRPQLCHHWHGHRVRERVWLDGIWLVRIMMRLGGQRNFSVLVLPPLCQTEGLR